MQQRQTLRNDQTEKGHAFWEKFEQAGERAPEWFKERINTRLEKAQHTKEEFARSDRE